MQWKFQVKRNWRVKRKRKIRTPSFELPSTFPQKRYLPCVSRSASWRAAAALFKIPSRAAASHDSLTIRVICNSFLVVLAPTSAVRNVFLLRRWWPLHTDLGRVENCSSLSVLASYSLVITLPFPFLSSDRNGEREKGKKFTKRVVRGWWREFEAF